MSKKRSTKIVTPECVACYVRLLQPEESLSGDMKYSVTLAIPKTENIDQIQEAILNAIANKWGEDKSKWPKNLKMPLRDGAEKDDPWWHDKWFINASAKEDRKPGLVDAQLNPIVDADEIYSGMIVRAAVRFFPFDAAGNRGVGCGFGQSYLPVRPGSSIGQSPELERGNESGSAP